MNTIHDLASALPEELDLADDRVVLEHLDALGLAPMDEVAPHVLAAIIDKARELRARELCLEELT